MANTLFFWLVNAAYLFSGKLSTFRMSSRWRLFFLFSSSLLNTFPHVRLCFTKHKELCLKFELNTKTSFLEYFLNVCDICFNWTVLNTKHQLTWSFKTLLYVQCIYYFYLFNLTISTLFISNDIYLHLLHIYNWCFCFDAATLQQKKNHLYSVSVPFTLFWDWILSCN